MVSIGRRAGPVSAQALGVVETGAALSVGYSKYCVKDKQVFELENWLTENR